MKTVKILLLIFGLGLGAGALSWAAGGSYRFMASAMAGAAKSKHKHLVAVIGFLTEAGRASRACAIVTARLTSELASKSGIEVLERGRLDEVMQEAGRGRNGIVDAATLKKIGTTLGADAAVTGTLIELDDNKIEVYTRLVDTRDGRILKALTTTIRKDWKEEKHDDWNGINMDVDLDLDSAPEIPDDYNKSGGCGKLSDEDVSLVRTCVELRARKTAFDMKTGALKLSEMTKNPGADIKDEGLKRLFYSKMKEWYGSEQLTRLTPQEEALLEKGAPLVEKYPCQ